MTPIQHLRQASRDFGSTPDDLVVMVGDALLEWQKRRHAVTAAQRRDCEQAALQNTFQALSAALRVAGVPREKASALFRLLIAESEALQ